MAMNREWFQLARDGLLVYVREDKRLGSEARARWVLPLALRPLALRLAHDNIAAQHPSVEATHTKLARRFFWRGLAEDVREYVMSCIPRQQSKPQRTAKYAPVLMPAEQTWQRLHADHTKMGCTLWNSSLQRSAAQ